MENKYCIVITTYSDKGDGEKIVNGLISNRLAACVQAMEINSFYPWKGQVNNDHETLLLIKTKSTLFKEVETFIKSVHSYEIPEIIQVPIMNGYAPYLNWMEKECK